MAKRSRDRGCKTAALVALCELEQGRPNLRGESLKRLSRRQFVALPLGLGKNDGVRTLPVEGDHVLESARAMPGGNLNGQVLNCGRELVHLRQPRKIRINTTI